MVVYLEKIGFIKGKYIIHNLTINQESIEWVHKSRQKALLLKIDFDKAYDKIEWDFILDVLDLLGFGSFFTDTMATLFTHALARVYVNGTFSKSILLQRSIQQGCPLALYFYVIVANAMPYLLEENAGRNQKNLPTRR